MQDEYSRMNPDDRLFDILLKYSKITYGAEAYPLSVAEARFILETIENLDDHVIQLLTDGIKDD